VKRSGLALARAAAGGFVAGVLLVAILGGAQPARTTTVTVARVETRTLETPATQTTGGTVVVEAPVPAVVGQPLDVAEDRMSRAGFEVDTDGGGALGILVPSNWSVVAQDPGAGTMLEQGSTVTLAVVRR
jgi:hypothetical protein